MTIVGGTITNLAVNVGRRHPLREGPLIDWDLILVMEPSTILGAILGTYVNHVLPPWITTLSLALLLGYITSNLVKKARALSAKDRERTHAEQAARAELDAGGGDIYASISTSDLRRGSDEDAEEEEESAEQADVEQPLLGDDTVPRRLRKRDRVRRLATKALEHYQPELPWLKCGVLFALLACTSVAAGFGQRRWAEVFFASSVS